MRERLATIDGSLMIESAPGRGTRVLALAPLKDDDINGDKHA
jgi:signal transduction histidine kinase